MKLFVFLPIMEKQKEYGKALADQLRRNIMLSWILTGYIIMMS